MSIDSDDEDKDADQTLLHLDFLDDPTDNNRRSIVGSFSEKEQLHQNEVIRCLKEVGRFFEQTGTFIFIMKNCTWINLFWIEHEQFFVTHSSLSPFSVKIQYSAQKNAEWQGVIKADVLRKRQQDIIGDTLLDSDVS